MRCYGAALRRPPCCAARPNRAAPPYQLWVRMSAARQAPGSFVGCVGYIDGRGRRGASQPHGQCCGDAHDTRWGIARGSSVPLRSGRGGQ
jgi:hypothetical protein